MTPSNSAAAADGNRCFIIVGATISRAVAAAERQTLERRTMQPTLTVLILLAACAAKPDMPNTRPATPSRMEGLKALANCTSTLENETRVSLVGEATETESGPGIRFTLVNTSVQTMKLYPFQLPWGNPNSIQIAATTLSGEELPVVWPIADRDQRICLRSNRRKGSRERFTSLTGSWMSATRKPRRS